MGFYSLSVFVDSISAVVLDIGGATVGDSVFADVDLVNCNVDLVVVVENLSASGNPAVVSVLLLSINILQGQNISKNLKIKTAYNQIAEKCQLCVGGKYNRKVMHRLRRLNILH